MYTKRVVTPYYRPPENCLSTPYYDEKVDVWSAGCVLAEFFTRRPLFRAMSEMEQLPCIFKTLLPDDASLPTEKDWPGFRALLDQAYPNGSFPSITEGAK